MMGKPVAVTLTGTLLVMGTLATGSTYAGFTATAVLNSNVKAIAMSSSVPIQLNELTVQMNLPIAVNPGPGTQKGPPSNNPPSQPGGQGGPSAGSGPSGTGGPNPPAGSGTQNGGSGPGPHGPSGPPSNNPPSQPGGQGGPSAGSGPSGTGGPNPPAGSGIQNGGIGPGPHGPSGPPSNESAGKHGNPKASGQSSGAQNPLSTKGNPPAPQPVPVSLQGKSIGHVANLTGQSLDVSISMAGLPGYQLTVSQIRLAPGAVVPLILQGPDITQPGRYQVVITVSLGGFMESRSTVVDIQAPATPTPPVPPKP